MGPRVEIFALENRTIGTNGRGGIGYCHLLRRPAYANERLGERKSRFHKMEGKSGRVCVTGAASYIGSLLVKKLLEKGHIVHATLRNMGDHSKTGLLKSLPGADTRLFLFEADIYRAAEFEPAIQGCEFVFLVATPLQHYVDNKKYKDTSEAAVDAMRTILHMCKHMGSVKRVIYTGSVTSTSPLKEDGTGFRATLDESCWTALNLSYAHCEDFEKSYVCSKTLAEKEALSYNDREEGRGLEVVSLACGLVGGNALVSPVPMTVEMILWPITGKGLLQKRLKFLQALLGAVPLVHVDDVCEAHIFCMDKPSMAGRFLCASAYLTMQEIVDYFKQNYPEMIVSTEVENEPERKIRWSSTKLRDIGFEYHYNVKKIIDDSVEYAKRLGGL